MSDETTRVDAFLQSKLSSDTPLTTLAVGGIHGDIAEAGAAYPFVVHQWQGSSDVQGVGPNRIMVSGLWLVRGIGQGPTWTVLAPIADRLDVLLQGSRGTAGSDGMVFSCVRERPFKQVEPIEGGEQLRHLGGLYRVEVQVP